ncbi:MAG: YebC/PmpR family DNA-binding transcriptional regulator, partial [Selenomonadaceae bacterium]|nr:YebC/PmpR family DNA-binding transcriptional regulator [Selenomonadaceae bacterium]
MSGHSKWANIKRKKGANDAIRGKITTKIGREITIAVRMGGADPTGNMRLKLALSKAKANNIPKDNINRAIQKGLGATEGSNYEEITYEGYGPGGSAIMLDILTDNRNRTAADVRHLFSRFGGNLGETGCVGWMFKQKAVFVVEKETFGDEDALMDIVLEAGAEDMRSEDDVFEITAEPADFDAIEAALGEKGIETASAEITMVPDNT